MTALVDVVLEYVTGVLELLHQAGGLDDQDPVRAGRVGEWQGVPLGLFGHPSAALLRLVREPAQLRRLFVEPVFVQAGEDPDDLGDGRQEVGVALQKGP